MQSDKKFRRDKKEKIQALDFARGFVMSVGDKATAQAKALVLAKANEETKNFWLNIAGHIGKVLFVLFFLSGCQGINMRECKDMCPIGVKEFKDSGCICMTPKDLESK